MFKFTVAIAGATLVAGILWGLTGMGVTAVLLTSLFLIWYLYQWSYIRVPEMEIAVVYHAERRAFSRFLPTGHHRLTPFLEEVVETISTAPTSVKGCSQGLQTIGGISLSVDWSLTYSLNPFKTDPASWPKLARSLPTKAAVIAQNFMNNSLQHIIGEYTIEHLTQPGTHKRLERQVKELVAQRLAVLGFEIASVMIGAIELPPHVKKALEAAHEHHLQMETEAKGLARMQQVISQFSEGDMQRLMELERIYKMGQNGVTLVYPAMSPDRDFASSPKNSYTKVAANKAVVAPGVS
ncbi:MAG: SPFH domain-containing protein [Ardenticatenaceae bacterium]|nr:SPFH domain-containing protein [Ardenticatenaceae bacterium]